MLHTRVAIACIHNIMAESTGPSAGVVSQQTAVTMALANLVFRGEISLGQRAPRRHQFGLRVDRAE